jgi:soluble lytic murein transglycosylase-like protein
MALAVQGRRAAAAALIGVALAGCDPQDRAEIDKLTAATASLWAGLRQAYAAAQPAEAAPAQAGASPAPRAGPEREALIAEAANRFDVPQTWIRAVMRVESDGDPAAISPKGAMGLMQVMPETYAYLSDRYGLGKDPYSVRDNVLAGSAYLREMHERYGDAGFIAAYNAGPGRYEDCLASGRALPYETQRYVASIRLAVSRDLFGRPGAPFYEPIAISPKGELLLGSTGKPLPAADRLALHELVARAAKRAESSR